MDNAHITIVRAIMEPATKENNRAEENMSLRSVKKTSLDNCEVLPVMCEEKAKCPKGDGVQQTCRGRQPESKPAILLVRSFFLEFNQQEYLQVELCLNIQASKAVQRAVQDMA
jgi:hypothetical protein